MDSETSFRRFDIAYGLFPIQRSQLERETIQVSMTHFSEAQMQFFKAYLARPHRNVRRPFAPATVLAAYVRRFGGDAADLELLRRIERHLRYRRHDIVRVQRIREAEETQGPTITLPRAQAPRTRAQAPTAPRAQAPRTRAQAPRTREAARAQAANQGHDEADDQGEAQARDDKENAIAEAEQAQEFRRQLANLQQQVATATDDLA